MEDAGTGLSIVPDNSHGSACRIYGNHTKLAMRSISAATELDTAIADIPPS